MASTNDVHLPDFPSTPSGINPFAKLARSNGRDVVTTSSGSGNFNTDAYNGNSPWTITPSNANGTNGFVASNYNITYNNATTGLTVNPLALSVVGVSGTDKVYDATTNDPITGTANLSSAYISGDNVTLSLQMTDEAEQTRIFDGLAQGGKVDQQLEDAPWGARFGMLTDRFGLHWLLNCPKPH